jgi:hypothetical protein
VAYTIIFLTIAVMLANPRLGIQNEEADPGEISLLESDAVGLLLYHESKQRFTPQLTLCVTACDCACHRALAGVGVVPCD